MKTLLAIFALLVGALYTVDAQAQIPKVPGIDLPTQLLGALNNVEGLGLNADQTSKLKDNNKSFTDDIFNVLNSAVGDDSKKSQFLNLKKTRQKFLMGLLGQQLLGKYNKKIGTLIKPFKKQLGLAALAL
ncbi:hypothetical protein [Cyclobacterium xiamenense]|uniref:hypothetical protein n=1 Tax=Cyclobacterium xiamenense TaxID=1297121 RepID=UPI0035D0FB67